MSSVPDCGCDKLLERLPPEINPPVAARLNGMLPTMPPAAKCGKSANNQATKEFAGSRYFELDAV
jgi:hypothetical protein